MKLLGAVARQYLRHVKHLWEYNFHSKKITVNNAGLPRVYVMLAADYGNLGDHAITDAQVSFIQETLPGYPVAIINIRDTYRYLKHLKVIMRKEDIITLIGGGNMGSIYPAVEERRRAILKNFPENRIISFPQSTFFSDDVSGRETLNDTIYNYSKHNTFYLFARDSKTYDFMRTNFTNNSIGLVPDIVLSGSHSRVNDTVRNQKKIILSLRSDAEVSMVDGASSEIEHRLQATGYEVVVKDTEAGSSKLSSASGRKMLQEHLGLYSTSSVVVTDRLHGVIFCAITGTPCIAIDNSYGKVHALCDTWLSDIAWIHAMRGDDIDLIVKQVESMSSKGFDTLPVAFNEEFNDLRFALRGEGV